MKRISDKEYNEYMTLLEQRRNGEILTFDGLELIIKANEFDFEKIGEQIVKSWYRIKKFFKINLTIVCFYAILLYRKVVKKWNNGNLMSF